MNVTGDFGMNQRLGGLCDLQGLQQYPTTTGLIQQVHAPLNRAHLVSLLEKLNALTQEVTGLLLRVAPVLVLMFLLSSALGARAQQCTSHEGITVTTSGNNLLLPAPADPSKNYHVCAMYVRVMQNATPATFQVLACTDATCTTSTKLSPAWAGQANAADKYDFSPGANAQLQVRRGYGIYLVLSSAPSSAQIQIVYGLY